MTGILSLRSIWVPACLSWMVTTAASFADDCPPLGPVGLSPGDRLVYAVDAGGGQRFDPAFLVDVVSRDGYSAELSQWMQITDSGEPDSAEPHSRRTMVAGIIPLTETLGSTVRRFVYRRDPVTGLSALQSGDVFRTGMTQIYPSADQSRTLRIEGELQVRHAGCESISLGGRTLDALVFDVEYDRGDSRGQTRSTRMRYWVPAEYGLAVRNRTHGSGTVAEVVEIRP